MHKRLCMCLGFLCGKCKFCFPRKLPGNVACCRLYTIMHVEHIVNSQWLLFTSTEGRRLLETSLYFEVLVRGIFHCVSCVSSVLLATITPHSVITVISGCCSNIAKNGSNRATNTSSQTIVQVLNEPTEQIWKAYLDEKRKVKSKSVGQTFVQRDIISNN